MFLLYLTLDGIPNPQNPMPSAFGAATAAHDEERQREQAEEQHDVTQHLCTHGFSFSFFIGSAALLSDLLLGGERLFL
jgi:hypothetical protein